MGLISRVSSRTYRYLKMLKCRNNACKFDPHREYNEEDNHETRCKFHPGGPIFHEGLKGWSCCKKRVIDFNDFLNIPGCTVGPCNPIPMDERNKQNEENASKNSSKS